MPVRKNAFAAALALSISTFAIAGASEMKPEETARQGFVVPSVISVAYRDPRIATNAAEAFRQGGFKVAGATRWLGAPEPVAPVAAFTAPGVISVSYRDPRISMNGTEVRRQGGFAAPGAVRWLAAAPDIIEVKADTIKLGAL
jgi:hypothetical protein